MTQTGQREQQRRAAERPDAAARARGSRLLQALRFWATGLALASVTHCGHPDGPRTDETVPIVAPGADGGTISALSLDGVWIFRMTGFWGQEAILSGEAGIDGDCLVVGDHVVIWPPTGRGFRAVEVLAAARSGRGRLVQLAGGESGDVPAVVAERCAIDRVWRVNGLDSAR